MASFAAIPGRRKHRSVVSHRLLQSRTEELLPIARQSALPRLSISQNCIRAVESATVARAHSEMLEEATRQAQWRIWTRFCTRNSLLQRRHAPLVEIALRAAALPPCSPAADCCLKHGSAAVACRSAEQASPTEVRSPGSAFLGFPLAWLWRLGAGWGALVVVQPETVSPLASWRV